MHKAPGNGAAPRTYHTNAVRAGTSQAPLERAQVSAAPPPTAPSHRPLFGPGTVPSICLQCVHLLSTLLSRATNNSDMSRVAHKSSPPVGHSRLRAEQPPERTLQSPPPAGTEPAVHAALPFLGCF